MQGGQNRLQVHTRCILIRPRVKTLFLDHVDEFTIPQCMAASLCTQNRQDIEHFPRHVTGLLYRIILL